MIDDILRYTHESIVKYIRNKCDDVLEADYIYSEHRTVSNAVLMEHGLRLLSAVAEKWLSRESVGRNKKDQLIADASENFIKNAVAYAWANAAYSLVHQRSVYKFDFDFQKVTEFNA